MPYICGGKNTDYACMCVRLCRSRIKLAYQTHYVGDLRYFGAYIQLSVNDLHNLFVVLVSRAVNAQQIDTYQLKSLDGQFGELSM